jgi:hypothetical protein
MNHQKYPGCVADMTLATEEDYLLAHVNMVCGQRGLVGQRMHM